MNFEEFCAEAERIEAERNPQRAQDRKDAKRYRWLIGGKRRWLGSGAYYFAPVKCESGQTLDAAIDAAMQDNHD